MMLTFFLNCTRPETKFSVNQCYQFRTDRKLLHEKRVNIIYKYLKGTSEEGIIMKVDTEHVIDFYVDTYFSGGCSQGGLYDLSSVLSRSGYVISYFDFPIVWSI